MKKIKVLALGLGLAAFLGSCTIYHDIQITGANVGTKVGVAKTKLFAKDQDTSIATAAKNGKIDKIGTVDIKTRAILMFLITTTTVTGE